METKKDIVNAIAFYDKSGSLGPKISTLVGDFLEYARYICILPKICRIESKSGNKRRMLY
jgi:hypothetical protein